MRRIAVVLMLCLLPAASAQGVMPYWYTEVQGMPPPELLPGEQATIELEGIVGCAMPFDPRSAPDLAAEAISDEGASMAIDSLQYVRSYDDAPCMSQGALEFTAELNISVPDDAAWGYIEGHVEVWGDGDSLFQARARDVTLDLPVLIWSQGDVELWLPSGAVDNDGLVPIAIENRINGEATVIITSTTSGGHYEQSVELERGEMKYLNLTIPDLARAGSSLALTVDLDEQAMPIPKDWEPRTGVVQLNDVSSDATVPGPALPLLAVMGLVLARLRRP